MPTMDDPNYRKVLIVEHEAAKWINDKGNWYKWRKEMRFRLWKPWDHCWFHGRILVTDIIAKTKRQQQKR